jgi:hypothetical protein
MSLGHCLTEIIATILAVRGVQTHVHGTQRELNLSASCLLSCLRSTQNNSNKISQTNNTTQTTQVQHHNPANNKPSPQLVIETPLEHLAQAPFSPAPALASKSSTRRQNVFIASPGFSSLLADRPLPALLPLPVALFLFPLLLSLPLSCLSTQNNIRNITMVGTRKRRAEESEEEELQSLPEDSEEEEE